MSFNSTHLQAGSGVEWFQRNVTEATERPGLEIGHFPRGIVIFSDSLQSSMETLDKVFDVLSEERRRYALYYLEQEDGPVPVEELVEQIAAWETDGSAASIPEEKFEEIELEFYHTNLPKTADLQYVQYDSESGIVELTGPPPRVDAIISVARVIERPDQNP